MAGSRVPPLLKLAILGGVTPAVRLYLDRGGDPDAVDGRGQPLLVLAASAGSPTICRMLIEAGVDLTATSAAALEAAKARSFHEVVKLLQSCLPEQSPTSPPDGDFSNDSPVNPASQVSEEIASEEHDDEGDNLSLWEPEDDSKVPESDLTVQAGTTLLQQKISEHVPVDTTEDWSDIEVELPQPSRSRTRSASAADLRRQLEIDNLLLEGLRYGALPFWRLQDSCTDSDGAEDEELLLQLSVVLDDAGVIFEETDYWEWFKSETDAEDSDDAEDRFDECVRFLSLLRDSRHDPLWIYAAAMQQYPLLSKQDEIDLTAAFYKIRRNVISQVENISWCLDEISRLIDQVISSKYSLHHFFDPSPECRDVFNGIPQNKSKNLIETVNEDVRAHRKAPLQPSETEKELLRKWQNFEHQIRKVTVRHLGLTTTCLVHLASGISKFKFDFSTPDEFLKSVESLILVRNRLVSSNLRLVMKTARKYPRSGFSLLDLIQEGNLGLMRAIDKFDFSRGHRLSTYATWWIRQSIQRFVENSQSIIRIPVHIHRHLREVETSRLVAPQKVSGSLKSCQGNGTVSENDRRFIPFAVLPLDECDPGNGHYAADPSFTDDSSEEIYSTLDLKLVRESLRLIPSRAARILRLRFGLEDGHPRTLEEVGEIMKVTRERIRQIEKKAIEKLRDSDLLKDFRS